MPISETSKKKSIDQVNLEDYRPEPHPLKQELIALNVSQRILARYLGITSVWLCSCLNGYFPMPKHLEKKIKDFIKSKITGGNQQ